jgi:hypothetical protein
LDRRKWITVHRKLRRNTAPSSLHGKLRNFFLFLLFVVIVQFLVPAVHGRLRRFIVFVFIGPVFS